ncbi:hypothetical protein [Methylacidiphilum caldifontis]
MEQNEVIFVEQDGKLYAAILSGKVYQLLRDVRI